MSEKNTIVFGVKYKRENERGSVLFKDFPVMEQEGKFHALIDFPKNPVIKVEDGLLDASKDILRRIASGEEKASDYFQAFMDRVRELRDSQMQVQFWIKAGGEFIVLGEFCTMNPNLFLKQYSLRYSMPKANFTNENKGEIDILSREGVEYMESGPADIGNMRGAFSTEGSTCLLAVEDGPGSPVLIVYRNLQKWYVSLVDKGKDAAKIIEFIEANKKRYYLVNLYSVKDYDEHSEIVNHGTSLISGKNVFKEFDRDRQEWYDWSKKAEAAKAKNETLDVQEQPKAQGNSRNSRRSRRRNAKVQEEPKVQEESEVLEPTVEDIDPEFDELLGLLLEKE